MRALAIGRLVPIKNYPLLLSAWTRSSIPIDILGDGPQRTELEEYAKLLNLTSNVFFRGHVEETKQYLQGADMFVSTSRNEGFGYAVLEALQSDCVVLSTRTGIAAEILPVQYVCDPKPEKFGNLVLQVANDLEAAKADFQPIWDVAKSRL